MSTRRKLTQEQLDETVKLYESGMTSYQIAAKFGVSSNTILNYLRSDGIEIRLPGRPAVEIPVGTRFGRLVTITPSMVGFDSRREVDCKCDCGTKVTVRKDSLTSRRVNSCGCLSAEIRRYIADKSGSWKGGRVKQGGYIKVKAASHPNANVAGYVSEHTKIMSEFLGRPLVKGENVHHINGVRDDNRLENLELWSTSQPSGQRVEDKIEWAKELLRHYEPESLAIGV